MKVLKWFLLFLLAVMLVRELFGSAVISSSVIAEVVSRFNAGYDEVLYSIARIGALWRDPGSMAWYEILLSVVRTIAEAILIIPRIIYQLATFVYDVFSLFFSLSGTAGF